MNSPAEHERGTTLVEIALAAGLLAMAATALLTLLLTTWARQPRAREMERAALLASARMEELRAVPYDAVQSDPDWQPKGFADGDVTVTEVPGSEGLLKKVTITVWRQAGGRPYFVLEGYIQRRRS